METDTLFRSYYYSRADFVDGTTEFHNLCRQFLTPGETILEIGAGPINRTSGFLSTVGTVLGVDVSDEVLTNTSLADARVYDGSRLPFPDAHFRACVSDYVIEHIGNPSDHFREIARVLQPSGIYCFRTPNLYHYVTLASRLLPHSLHLRLANRLRAQDLSAHDPYPTVYRANTRARIRALSEPVGLAARVLRNVEKEPSYGRISPHLFFPMMAYERIVNSSQAFESLRVNIFGVLQKVTA